MSFENVKDLIQGFARISNVINLEWDPILSEKLLFDPFSTFTENQKRIAQYFLLVASITETDLIGRAENARALMIHINKMCINDLFEINEHEIFRNILETYPFYNELGPERYLIPEVLVSVNEYVRDIGKGNFLDYVSHSSFAVFK